MSGKDNRIRTRVKICGITNPEDARLAVELGTDALGFIFYEQSPRYITPAAAREITAALPPFITPVAVAVNPSDDEISEIIAVSGCRVLQWHGDNPQNCPVELSWPVVAAVSVGGEADLQRITDYPQARAILLDTKQADCYGGTGAPFDWELARLAKTFGKPIILAGGLSPENIAEAIRIVQPHAVDANSCLECAPGRKDAELMRAFFRALPPDIR